HPRVTSPESGYTWTALRNALLDRNQALLPAFLERPAEFNGSAVHEGLYIGVLPLLLLVCGVAAEPLPAAPLLGGLALLLWAAMGTQVAPSAWAALHHIPVFGQMRMVQRFGIGGILLLSIVAGFGFDSVGRWVARVLPKAHLATPVMSVVALAILADL